MDNEKAWGCVLIALIALAAFAFVINPIAHYVTGTVANEVAKGL